MHYRHGAFLKHLLSATLILSVGGLGLLGIVVSLFPPGDVETDMLTTLLGLTFSALFLVAAWVIRRWSKRCLLCEHHED